MRTNSYSAEIAANKDKVAASFRELVAGTEDLLRSTASYTGEEVERSRKRLRQQLEVARGVAGEWEQTAAERARRASEVTDQYVHENAWKSIGVAALVGLLVGACLSSSDRR
ncbi:MULTISPECIES: YqjD family protein [unclassified Achromobacter]|jgi:ElaB/YqjD/DUF883 family membrane-anchored ribosome-binding protein|uniref:DUF883 family protein n=1 Tax=unclassified Achromobacter TaxID=2626865 RepID=UPI000B515045|nr:MULTISPECIES: DUF883 family protein [unclassified Achromobacter]OWT67928.1 hypothetical protein CEY05_30260 [Achromobacter sp. HZ34]OWT67998.1 hypothetical protein CEY04_29935 [Achromobacter sp. HZ28]